MGKLITKLIELKPLWALALFTLLDIICIGMGMGIPFFCILFGLPVGWYLVRHVTASTTRVHEVLRRVLRYAVVASAVTMLGMLAIWGTTISWLYEPGYDLVNTGVPQILYEPRASFIGWLALMIVISPILQLLTTLFGSYLTFLGWLDHNNKKGIKPR